MCKHKVKRPSQICTKRINVNNHPILIAQMGYIKYSKLKLIKEQENVSKFFFRSNWNENTSLTLTKTREL